MNIKTSTLTRAAAIALVISGLIYVAIQFTHPLDEVESLTTQAWVNVHSFSFGMAVLGLIGITGVYLRQVRQFGILGLIAYLMFGFFFILQSAFVFAEAFIAPLLVTDAPQLAKDFVGLFGGQAAETDLGPLAALPLIGAPLYILGALLFGVAIIRARVLSRGGGILLIAAAVVTPIATALLPHQLERGAAIPMGLAMIWVGYSLFSDVRKNKVTASKNETLQTATV